MPDSCGIFLPSRFLSGKDEDDAVWDVDLVVGARLSPGSFGFSKMNRLIISGIGGGGRKLVRPPPPLLGMVAHVVHVFGVSSIMVAHRCTAILIASNTARAAGGLCGLAFGQSRVGVRMCRRTPPPPPLTGRWVGLAARWTHAHGNVALWPTGRQ